MKNQIERTSNNKSHVYIIYLDGSKNEGGRVAIKNIETGVMVGATIIEVNRGWTTYVIDGYGSENVKYRNGVLVDMAESEVHEVPSFEDTISEIEATDEEIKAEIGGKTMKVGGKVHDVSKYVTHNTRTESGRKSFDSNDYVALLLRGRTLGEVYLDVAEATGIKYSILISKYGHLNKGMQRMNLGNLLRKTFKTFNK